MLNGRPLRSLARTSSSSSRALLFHDLQACFDLGGIGAGAVAAQKELHHVGGDWVLAEGFADQDLADQEASESLGPKLIEMVHLAGGSWCAGHGNTSS
jgi:hypothetical protein